MQDNEIDLDVKYGLELIDVDAIERAAPAGWFNRTLCQVNDCVIRLGVAEGEFHWHKHEREDEFFFVVSGELLVDLEDGSTVELKPNEGYAVPRGLVHGTRAPQRTVMLKVEGATVSPAGDA